MDDGEKHHTEVQRRRNDIGVKVWDFVYLAVCITIPVIIIIWNILLP